MIPGHGDRVRQCLAPGSPFQSPSNVIMPVNRKIPKIKDLFIYQEEAGGGKENQSITLAYLLRSGEHASESNAVPTDHTKHPFYPFYYRYYFVELGTLHECNSDSPAVLCSEDRERERESTSPEFPSTP